LNILSKLASHGVQPKVISMQFQAGEIQKVSELESLLYEHPEPVVIFHTISNSRVESRQLTSSSNSTSTTVPISEENISQYQICLWSAVLFVVLLYMSINSVATMEAIPDSILYAKFQSGRTEKRE
jgi:hypothetical protein